MASVYLPFVEKWTNQVDALAYAGNGMAGEMQTKRKTIDRRKGRHFIDRDYSRNEIESE